MGEEEQCPICFQQFPADVINLHCDSHFADSPAQAHLPVPSEEDEVTVLEPPRQQPRTHNRRSAGIPQRPLAAPSQPTAGQEPQDNSSTDLSHLLQASLGAQASGQAYVVGYCRHFYTARGDSGWGCGWRNMQMMIAALQVYSQDFKNVICGGIGHVPNIEVLQAAVEGAWRAGFDRRGAEQLDHRLRGTRKWVGTTEATALLRSFGIRARIVDFTGGASSSGPGQANGPSGETHPGVQCDGCGQIPIRGQRHHSAVLPDYDLCGACQAQPRHQAAAFSVLEPPSGQCSKEALVEWIWQYFSSPSLHGGQAPPSGQPVVQAGRLPLYFQHQGHSRTIVGIQRTASGTASDDYSLLLLDPGTPASTLHNALSQQRGWQRYVKRGMHTLKHPEYQVMYIEDGIAGSGEIHDLKTIRSTLISGRALQS